MKMKKLLSECIAFAAVAGILSGSADVLAQSPTKPAPAKPMIFAVLNDGKMIEPIGWVDKGGLDAPTGGDATAPELKLFNTTYYKKGTSYKLIFGGAVNGTVTVSSSDPASDCAKNMATVGVAGTKTKLGGRVMALATNAPGAKKGAGVRRLPTPAERVIADNLVKAEFAKQGNSAAVIETRDYHNLTALDVDGDGKIELVGSFWVKPDEKTRNTLFFIADKGSDGKYRMGFGKYNSIKEDSVMNGEISTIDGGVYHELLLDVFDLDGDGVSEVFSYVQSFEGASFNVYMRVDGKWNSVFEGSNYHCGF